MIKKFEFKIDWLFWFLILAPTFYMAGVETRFTQLEFFKVAIIALIAMFHSNKWIGAFLGYMVFQFLFLNSQEVTKIIPNVFFGAVLYHFIVKYGRPSAKYLWALYGVLIFNVLWCVLQIYQIDPVWQMVDTQNQVIFTEYPGFFALPAFLGNYAAVALPLSFVLSPVLFPFALIGLFFSKSSFSVLAGLCASLFFFWHKKRIFFWGILIFFGVCSAIYVTKDLPTGQFTRRISAWSLILKEACKQQFLGHGAGSYGGKYSVVEVSPSLNNKFVQNNKEMLDFIASEAIQNGKPEIASAVSKIPQFNTEYAGALQKFMEERQMDFNMWVPAHNEYLQSFFDMGLVGIFIIGGYIFDMTRRFYLWGDDGISLALMASFVAIIIISLGHFPFHIARLAAPFISILALLDTSLLRREYEVR